jgi:hypothetical protein
MPSIRFLLKDPSTLNRIPSIRFMHKDPRDFDTSNGVKVHWDGNIWSI